ncbi:MAG: SAM-dependent methyltransferase [Deltaproteobacteria bacterium]|nr:MAG: SAM-dependent methyltransferase [Deltaproteobacteria bacterium]
MTVYHWNAEDYEKHSRGQQKWAGELITRLDLNGSEQVLDIGCGDGRVTAEIAGLLPAGQAVGVDSSDAMISRAGKKYPPDKYSNLSFRQMDARYLSFDGTFDIVFSNAALHWVKNHAPVVNGIFKALKPGGRILLQMGGKGNAGDVLSVLDSILPDPQWKSYFDHFGFPYGFLGRKAYEELLDKAGFKIDRVELIPKNMELAGQSGLEGWIRTTWLPYTSRVPEEKKDEFIRAISTAYMKNFPMDSDGIVHVAMVRLEVEARKNG